MGGMPGGFGGMGSSDVKLQYIDDNPQSYSNIFDNAKTDITQADQQRLIDSLKILSDGENIESAVDVESVLRYFAVHNFVVNGDSYTGSMIHNYYLYEHDGLLSMLPWDYNLAFGTFMGTDARDAVNDPIDTPLSNDFSDRPMVSWIFADEAYLAKYHAYLDQFLEICFDSGWFETTVDTVSAMIAPYVAKDPGKFCTDAQFEQGVRALRQFGLLRAQSVRGQLDGTIPSTALAQRENAAALIDTADLALSDMGTMGGFGGGRGGDAFSSADFVQGDAPQPFGVGDLPEDTGLQRPDLPSDFGVPNDGGMMRAPGQKPARGQNGMQMPGGVPMGEPAEAGGTPRSFGKSSAMQTEHDAVVSSGADAANLPVLMLSFAVLISVIVLAACIKRRYR